MDEWDKFNEKVLPGKESFYSSLMIENISESGYMHANNVFENFNINNLGDYHDLYVKVIRCYLPMYLKILGKRV